MTNWEKKLTPWPCEYCDDNAQYIDPDGHEVCEEHLYVNAPERSRAEESSGEDELDQ